MLRATGPFDIGQAVVVADQRVLAVEGAEGTDRMLAHLAELRRPATSALPAGDGVLVKAAKAGQDRRLDLPSIGPRTLEGAARPALPASPSWPAAPSSPNPSGSRALADRAGLFVIGIDGGGGTAP